MDNPFFATAVVGASSLLLFGIILLAVSPFLNWLGGYGFTWYF